MNCGNCGHSKKNSRDGVYCLMFGIMVNRRHEGCRYYKEKEDVGNDTGNRNELDAAAAEAAG